MTRDCSNTSHSMPTACRLSAVANPPIPPPITNTFIVPSPPALETHRVDKHSARHRESLLTPLICSVIRVVDKSDKVGWFSSVTYHDPPLQPTCGNGALLVGASTPRRPIRVLGQKN